MIKTLASLFLVSFTLAAEQTSRVVTPASPSCLAGAGVLSVLCEGDTNTAAGSRSSVGGGGGNQSAGNFSTIAGGDNGTAGGSNSTIGGGFNNSAGNNGSTIAGGTTGNCSGIGCAIGGGISNTASGTYSAIPGGQTNVASGNNTFAAGVAARATSHGAIVFNANGTLTPTAAQTVSDNGQNTFSVYAASGIYLSSGSVTVAKLLTASSATVSNTLTAGRAVLGPQVIATDGSNFFSSAYYTDENSSNTVSIGQVDGSGEADILVEGNNAGPVIAANGYNEGVPLFAMHLFAGSKAAPTAVPQGDAVGILNFGGYSGAIDRSVANFEVLAAENWAPTAMGSEYVWALQPIGTVGGGARKNYMALAPNGGLILSDNVFTLLPSPSNRLTVSGSASVTSSVTAGAFFGDGTALTGVARLSGGNLVIASGVIYSSSTQGSISCTAGTGVLSQFCTDDHCTFAAGTAATSCTYTFGTAWPHTPDCIAGTDAAVPIAVSVRSASASSITITAATALTGDNVTFICRGRQ